MLWVLLLWSINVAIADRLAVLDFESTLGQDMSSLLADQARAAALDTLDPLEYSIITRENMMKILSDMGKDASCITGSCEVDLAQNIGADYVVSGTVRMVDEMYLLTLIAKVD